MLLSNLKEVIDFVISSDIETGEDRNETVETHKNGF